MPTPELRVCEPWEREYEHVRMYMLREDYAKLCEMASELSSEDFAREARNKEILEQHKADLKRYEWCVIWADEHPEGQRAKQHAAKVMAEQGLKEFPMNLVEERFIAWKATPPKLPDMRHGSRRKARPFTYLLGEAVSRLLNK